MLLNLLFGQNLLFRPKSVKEKIAPGEIYGYYIKGLN